MSVLFIVGKILFGGYFVYNGLNHLMENEMLGNYAKSKGVPFPAFAVAISGLFILLGGLGVLFWVYVEWALWLIVIFLLAVSVAIHNFWDDKDPATKMANTINFTKNMALVGAALMLMSLL